MSVIHGGVFLLAFECRRISGHKLFCLIFRGFLPHWLGCLFSDLCHILTKGCLSLVTKPNSYQGVGVKSLCGCKPLNCYSACIKQSWLCKQTAARFPFSVILYFILDCEPSVGQKHLEVIVNCLAKLLGWKPVYKFKNRKTISSQDHVIISVTSLLVRFKCILFLSVLPWCQRSFTLS